MIKCRRKRILLSEKEQQPSTIKKQTEKLLKIICWLIIPIAVTALIVLDALGIYIFSTERLLVLGVGLLIVLLPFFNEVTCKWLTVKRDRSGE